MVVFDNDNHISSDHSPKRTPEHWETVSLRSSLVVEQSASLGLVVYACTGKKLKFNGPLVFKQWDQQFTFSLDLSLEVQKDRFIKLSVHLYDITQIESRTRKFDPLPVQWTSRNFNSSLDLSPSKSILYVLLERALKLKGLVNLATFGSFCLRPRNTFLPLGPEWRLVSKMSFLESLKREILPMIISVNSHRWA